MQQQIMCLCSKNIDYSFLITYEFFNLSWNMVIGKTIKIDASDVAALSGRVTANLYAFLK